MILTYVYIFCFLLSSETVFEKPLGVMVIWPDISEAHSQVQASWSCGSFPPTLTSLPMLSSVSPQKDMYRFRAWVSFEVMSSSFLDVIGLKLKQINNKNPQTTPEQSEQSQQLLCCGAPSLAAFVGYQR